MFKKVVDYLGKAVQSNTGVSSISLILIAVGIMSLIVLLVICICMLIEIFNSKTIQSSLDGYAAIITAVAGLLASVGLPKALNNWGEHKYQPSSEDEAIDNV